MQIPLSKMTYKKALKKVWKTFLYLLLGVSVLLCLFLIFINLPVGKRVVRNQIQSYLQQKLKTKVVIGSVDYSLPTWIDINGIYVEDQNKDTLLFGEQVSTHISMFKLISGETDIHKLIFKNVFFNIKRAEKDSVFNYQFVVDAFSGNKPATVVNKDTASLKLTLDRLLFDHVVMRVTDKRDSSDLFASIDKLDATLNSFQPDKGKFGIKDFAASGVNFLMKTTKKTIAQVVAAPDSLKVAGYDLSIVAEKIDLRDVNVVVENSATGMRYGNTIAKLGISNVLFNLSQSIAVCDSITLDSSFVRFTNPVTIKRKVTSNSEATSTSMPWHITIGHAALNKDSIRYDDNNLRNAGGFDPGHFDIKDLTADVSAFNYYGNNTAALVKQFRFKDASGFTLDTTHVNFLMTDSVFSAKELYVKTPHSLLQNSIVVEYDSIAGITTHPKNSLVSAILNNSTIAFDDLYLLNPVLKKTFAPDQFAGNLVHFNTELRGNLAQLYLPRLQLMGLGGSNVYAHGILYNLTDAAKFYYDLYIEHSMLRKSDLLKFLPLANRDMLSELPAVINLRGRMVGNKDNLVSNIDASGDGFAISGRLSLKNISNPSSLKYDLAISKSRLSKKFLMKLIPPGSLPPGISLPEVNNISGTLTGNINNLVADLKLGGSYGLITVKGYIKNMKDPKTANYDLFITTDNYDIGKLLSQDSILGKVTGSFTAKGTGYDYKTMHSNIKASIKQLQYNRYNYHNADISANFDGGIIHSIGSINDSSLKLQYDIRSNVQTAYPSINGFVRVDTAQLQKLHLYKDTLNFSLHANIAANNLQPRHLDVNTLLDSVKVQVGKNYFDFDSLTLVATSANGRDSINFNSPFAKLRAAGAFDYDKVGDAAIQYINHYYKISDSLRVKNMPDQQMVFDGILKKHPFLPAIIPGLKGFDDINFKGSFASADKDSALNLTVDLPYLAYQDKTVRNGNIIIGSKNERLNYNITFDTLRVASTTFYGTKLKGSAANDSVLVSFRTQDNKHRDWFGFKASLFAKNELYSARLQDSLLLNYEKWNVASDNYIRYSPEGLIIHNFRITSDTASILINSRQELVNSPIDISIENFNLRSISSILNHDTVFVSGILDAKMEVNDLNKKIPAFTGDLSVDHLAIMEQPLGTLTLFAQKKSENNITTALNLVGNGNEINGKGTYYLDGTDQQFDASLIIKSLNVATLQGFTAGKIKNATGNLFGNMTMNGRFADPRWKGSLNFDTVQFNVAQLGAPFKINKQVIDMEYPDIRLKNFIIRDSLDNEMTIDGAITIAKIQNFGLKLDIKAKDFIIVNAPKAINSEVYGFAAIDADIAVTGNSTAPDIEGNIAVKDKSDLTIIIPEKSYGKDEGKTIVRFIDRDTFDINPPVLPFTPAKDTLADFAQFLNYNLNLEITKNAALTIVIDPVTGDEIKVQGDAQLNAGVDPGGHIVLSGTYELDKGHYLFNYQFLQRKFDLERGSTIVFAGEPMKAKINITAAYTVNTSSRDLLENEVGSVDPTLANSFNQKVPFKVILYLTGDLSKPIIKFDIQLPDDNSAINSDLRTTIENKLAQIRDDEAATNKQVFSLLLLGRFVGEQSSDFFKGNGNDFNDLARQSVSQFLSSALNEIAGNLLKGVDIDLNLNSYRDFSNGGNAQRTDLSVALTKTFLDNRLSITLGETFGVQGQNLSSNTNTSFIPDITIGYKLTADGKYMLRAYRKNQFEVVLDGYVVETGIGFVVTLDYDKFKELFTKKKKK